MNTVYSRRPFSWRGRNTSRAPRRTVPWVEELETRQVLSTAGLFPAHPLLIPQQTGGATTPALSRPTPSGNQTSSNGQGVIASFIVVNGSPVPSTSGPSALLLQTPGSGPSNAPLLPGTNTIAQLPPILQGVTVVPPSGSLTFADGQRITTDFIGGGHTETLLGPAVSSFNPPSVPRQMPSSLPVNVPFPVLEEETPLKQETLPDSNEITDALVPTKVGFDEGPQLITDQGDEVLRRMDGSTGQGVAPSAAPVLIATLAAHWADRQRRPEDDEPRR